jgi:ParB-like nuclease domain
MNDRPEPAALQSPLRNSSRQKSRRRRNGLARMQAAALPPASRNDLLPKLTLVKRDMAKLKLPSRKLRKLDPVHVKETAQAISSLGFCDPVLIDEDDNVIDGVVRIMAAKSIGLTHIPCLRAAHLTPTERRLLRLALNRLGEKGSWDLDVLKVEIEELILEDAPVEIAGFEPAELDQILLDDEEALVEEGRLSLRLAQRRYPASATSSTLGSIAYFAAMPPTPPPSPS